MSKFDNNQTGLIVSAILVLMICIMSLVIVSTRKANESQIQKAREYCKSVGFTDYDACSKAWIETRAYKIK